MIEEMQTPLNIVQAQGYIRGAIDEATTINSYIDMAQNGSNFEAYAEIIGDEINHGLKFFLMAAKALGITPPADGLEELLSEVFDNATD